MHPDDDLHVGDSIIGPKSQHVRKVLLYTILGIYTALVLSTYAMFIRRSTTQQGSDIARRSVALVTVQTAGVFILGVLGLAGSAKTDFPCVAKLWMLNFGLMLMSLGVAARACQFIVTSRLHVLNDLVAITDDDDGSSRCAEIDAPQLLSIASGASVGDWLGQGIRLSDTGDNQGTGSNWWSRRLEGNIRELEELHQTHAIQSAGKQDDAPGHSYRPLSSTPQLQQQRRSQKVAQSILTLDSNLACSADRGSMRRKLQKYEKLQRYTTDRMLLLGIGVIMLCVFTMTLVFTFVSPEFRAQSLHRRCRLTWPEYPVLGIIGAFKVTLYPFLLYMVWQHRDTYGIRLDLVICITLGTVNLILAVVWSLKLYRLSWILSGLFFVFITSIAMHITSIVVPLVKSKRLATAAKSIWTATPYVGDNANSLGDGSTQTSTYRMVVLADQTFYGARSSAFFDLLDNPLQFELFCQFATQSFCSELTAFVKEYQALKLQTVNAFTRRQKSSSVFVEFKGNLRDPFTEDQAFLNAARPLVAVDGVDDGTLQNRSSNGSLLSKVFRKRQSACSSLAAHRSTQARGVNTSVRHSILDTLHARLPSSDLGPSSQFPPALLRKIRSFVDVFIRPEAKMAVNLSGSVVDKILSSVSAGNLHLTILDQAKDETLKLLFTNVFVRYCSECVYPTTLAAPASEDSGHFRYSQL